jgi:hypothetical protein
MKRLVLALSLALTFVRPAPADTFTQLLLGVDTTPTPSPVCIMSPTGICAAQLGTWNIGTSTWTPAGGGGGGAISFPQTVAGTTTSGGVPYFSSTTQLSSSGFLTANALMVGGGAGAAPATVTTGTGVVTALGIAVNNASGLPTINSTLPTVGHCLQWGTSGVTDAGGACTTGGGGGTVSSGNAGQLTYYASTGTVVSGATTGTGVLTALGLATNALGGVLTTPAGACTSGQFLTFPTAGSVPTCATPAVSGLTVGATTIASGTNGYVQYNNGGLLGEKATTGTGNVVLSASPTFSGTIGGTQVVPYSALVNIGANTVLGQVLAGTPTQLSVPSCSGTGQALNFTSGGGFGCTTGGTVSSGNAGQLTYYAATGTVVSGATTGTGVLTALGLATNALGGFLTTPSGACTSGQFLTFPTAGSVPTCATPAVSGLTVGSTTISGGTNGYVQYNNGGLLGEKPTTGTGNVVLSASPTFSGTIGGSQIIPYSALSSISANVVLGQTTAGTPSQLPMPTSGTSGCAGANQAVNWTSGTGFGCTTISASGGLSNVYDVTNATYGCVASSSTSSADQASCIQSAINAASSAGGGVVWVPSGFWNLKSQVVVKDNITLQCASNGSFIDANTVTYSTVIGSTFAVLWGNGSGNSNNATYSALQLNRGAKVRGCNWWYPNQSASASTPTEYGSTIVVYSPLEANIGQEATDNNCINCYYFIDFRGGQSGPGGGLGSSVISRNRGSCIAVCVAMNFQVDWVQIENNKFNSGTLWVGDSSPSSHLRGWVALHGIVFYMGFGNIISYDHNSAWGYQYGHWQDFTTSFSGSSGLQSGPMVINEEQSDNVQNEVMLYGGTSNLRINGGGYDLQPAYSSASGILVNTYNSSTNVSGLTIANTQIYGPTQYIFYFSNGGTINNVIVHDNWLTSTSGATNCAIASSGVGGNINVHDNICKGTTVPVAITGGSNVTTNNNQF